MEVRQLEYFVAVAEEQSFTRAAARTYVVQSAVSTAVAKLERELGVPLFERSGRTVELTEPGYVLLTRARAVLAETRGAQEDLSRLADGLRGKVTLGTVLSTGSFALVRALTAFHAAYPHVVVHLRHSRGQFADLVADVQVGRFDLALLPMIEPSSPGVSIAEVGSIRMALAARSDDPLARLHDVGYEDLEKRRFIDFPKSWGNRSVVDRLFRSGGIHRKVSVEVVDVGSALDMVSAGLGLAFVPEEAVGAYHDLVRVDLRDPPRPTPLGLVIAEKRRCSEATKALRQTLLDWTHRSGEGDVLT